MTEIRQNELIKVILPMGWFVSTLSDAQNWARGGKKYEVSGGVSLKTLESLIKIPLELLKY
jgi:hypothetical protein